MDETNGTMPEPDLAERAELLLGAPLGRQFLGTFVDDCLEDTLFAALGLGDVPGTLKFAVEETPQGGTRTRTLRRRKRRDWRDVHAGEVRAVLRETVAKGEWRSLGELSEAAMMEQLSGVTELFGFGGGDVALWRLTASAAGELRPVAEALAAAPATAWWWDPVELTDQRQLVWEGWHGEQHAGRGLFGVEAAMRSEMARRHAQNERDAGRRKGKRRRRGAPRPGERNLGATWWSAPDFAPGTWTTGPRGGLPALELGHFIDTFFPFGESAASVARLTLDAGARVAEIRGPRDWQRLVSRFPCEVTSSHDGEWRDWGDVDGPWYLPDWAAVAGHYDGVHVTVGGFLATCGLAQPVGDGHTMLAGWVPDATLWLRDVVTDHRPLGVWRGDPDDCGEWEEILAGWWPHTPE
ncbi:hypothetical protein [Streptomyces albus]|uniref:hypothetical protein n=1 Tax=Streptomyces albus TaxID=1888 RepID=UPI000A5C2F4B|nr:hypothetical protein [Streptomyces albus]